jgi:hypothetical protein
MKPIFTILLIVNSALCASAQWSNTSNSFYDSLHMPVCSQPGAQTNSMLVSSSPDNGYFVIWEDKRSGFYAPVQVYAQKFDKDGNRLWAADGIPISTSANNQQFTFPSNQDYRNRKFAASDNAGGLYITYTDDSIATYDWKRVCVQHIRPDGGLVFPGPGSIIAQTPAGEAYNLAAPQLIADLEAGFYVAYLRQYAGNDYVYVYCYKDEGGIMKLYGGGQVNQNAISNQSNGPCVGTSIYSLVYPGTTVSDYNIWPDLQGNCSIIMSMSGNTGSQGPMLCYNKVWKAKQAQTVNIASVYPTGDPYTQTVTYNKGDIDILYKLRWNALDRNCTSPAGYNVWVDYIVTAPGFLVIDAGGVNYLYPKGATLATGGNINVETITSNKQVLINNSGSDGALCAVAFMDEIYPAIPYQRASSSDPFFGLNTVKPAGLDTFHFFRDTLLRSGILRYDYSLAAGTNQLYSAALIRESLSDNARRVRLQHLSIENVAAGEYQFKYETADNKGALIGSEISTGFQTSEIVYDFPVVTANKTGNALLYITEYGRSPRVSPILSGAELAWGAMGKPVSSTYINGVYANPALPFVALNPSDGTGLLSWQDERNVPANSGQNIYMRHLDSLNVVSYLPPDKLVKGLTTGSNFANPAYLTGLSKKYSVIEAYNNLTQTVSPVAAVLDNYNLGSVPVIVYESSGAVRTYNGKPYLDRNYTITPGNNPNGAADINVRLYFTAAQFDALKLADPTIIDPGSLAVIKQPNATGTAPSEFTPAGSEIELRPVAWQAVGGGYYLEIVVNSFSNFFIQKASAALPVTWLAVEAQWQNKNEAKINWQVADQQNVKDYIVQQSIDGKTFTNACSITASAATYYNCTVPAQNNTINYYRVLQRDNDGKFSYSKTVVLNPVAALSLSLHPNPAKGKLYIDGTNGYQVLTASDMNGKVLLQQRVTAGTNSIDVSQLRTGLYLLTARGDRGMLTLKFVKD